MVGIRYTVYLLHKELDKIYTFRMFDEDFCCCPQCPFSTADDWLQNHFKSHSYFNIEMKIVLDEDHNSNEHVNKVCAKVLGVVTSRYGVIYPIEQFKAIRIIKQVIPWSLCIKQERTNQFRLLTRDEILVVEDLTGLHIL